MKRYPITILYLLIFVFKVIDISYSQIYISTIEELQKIGNDPAYPLNGYYFLSNDIDASETRNWNGGKGFEPISYNNPYDFTGVLDGKGYCIRNLYINRPEDGYIGLFSDIDHGTIKNITIYDSYISGEEYTGTLAGYNWGGNISDIICSGTVNAKNGFTGGIVGESHGGDLEHVHYYGDIKSSNVLGGIVGYNMSNINCSYSISIIKGESGIGGIAGLNFGNITNCYSAGNISGERDVGGVVGLLVDTIENSYSISYVTGKEFTGGIFGNLGIFGTPRYKIINSYYDCEISGQPCGGKTGKSTDEMTSPGTFTNWDFENVWWMIPGKTYPLLRPVWFLDADLKPADWMPVPKYGFPIEFEIKFGEPVKNFTFEDIDFTSSTIENLTGELVMDGGTSWTLRITDTATTTPLFPAEIVLRLPVAAAINAANYPTTETAAIRIDFRAPVPGDLNGDGLCNAKDSDILAEWIVTPSSPWRSRLPGEKPDLNKDAKIDSADLVTLLSLWSK